MGTYWHITFGTYGDRLHGDERATIDRRHNKRGDQPLAPDAIRLNASRNRLKHQPVRLTTEQRIEIERQIPAICERGGWRLIEFAAGTNHVHVVLRADPSIHGRQIRTLLKRWLGQALNQRWSLPARPDGSRWWAEGGSNKPLHDDAYLTRATDYVRRQRTTNP